ncbi:hypothetical protein [Rhodopirellula europaea]|uniref:Secreted protein n=1 Tax=Rhodopirellula europaea 6C TaxID=1263867 RepID=M2A976_9BACT|nr:hypothetical protein [Rhodopirellula europaea]EMB18656.1 secreted protein [Rhodopirellula europaea 6C]|tara:strand:+ start:332 stop:679 length:348 start_codon:yes stop_codon:yes gene_type:complete
MKNCLLLSLFACITTIGCQSEPTTMREQAEQAQENLEAARDKAAEIVAESEEEAVERVAEARDEARDDIIEAKREASELIEDAKQNLEYRLDELADEKEILVSPDTTEPATNRPE